MMGPLYELLARIGYTHPLHPTLTHIPIGLIIGAFVFSLISRVYQHEGLDRTARSCSLLALLALFPTALLGVLDWQYRLQWAWIHPIRMKIFLAALLVVLLTVSLLWGRRAAGAKAGLPTLLLAVFAVVAMAYYGGELVYGRAAPATGEPGTEEATAGAEFFEKKCSMCHYTDRIETKIGPGLKCLFTKEKLPESGRPVTGQNIRSQLRDPYDAMPAFPDLTDSEVDALVNYLKTL